MTSKVKLIEKIKVTRKLGMTLMQIGIIPKRNQLDNFNLDNKKFFSLYECKEFVERHYRNGFFPEQRNESEN